MTGSGPDSYSLLSSCGPANSSGANGPAASSGKRTRIWRHALRRVLASVAFRALGITCLIIALFGSSLCVLLDAPDEPVNRVLDVVMCTVMAIFLLETVMRCIAESAEYPFSFFFWMDVLGSLSMVFEISFLLGEAGKMNTTDSGMSTVMMRTARAARVGARAGRLSKPLRCVSFFYAGHPVTAKRSSMKSKDTVYSAKILGARLTQVLSTKVAMLTVVLVLGVPILSIGRYPEDDFSLRFASIKLEADYARAYSEEAANQTRHAGTTPFFEASVEDVAAFYRGYNYYPYRLEGYPRKVAAPGGRTIMIPGTQLIVGEEPNRKQNIVRQEVSRCLVERPGCKGAGDKASIYFDFKVANQYGAMMDIFVVFFIILCMGLESWDLSRSVNKMVVTPLETMLQIAQSMTSVLYKVVSNAPVDEANEELEDEDDDEPRDEAEMLQHIFQKMAHLTTVFVEQNVVDEAKMLTLDAESKGVIVEMMQYGRNETRRSSFKGSFFPVGDVVKDLPVKQEEIESWGLNLLILDVTAVQKVVNHILFDSQVGRLTGRIWLDFDTFQTFCGAVRQGYRDNPYHCFTHGCDVVTSCFRILLQAKSDEWLGDLDTCSLLISALCHDVGHPGTTNQFLVEISDELALRYNDKSPLENMHCAKLFEICRDPHMNIFAKFDKGSYKQARSVCIAAILFTDNALHFDLVKEIRKVYETSSELCDQQSGSHDLNPSYLGDVVTKNTMLWIKVILHLADVSNPLKTFEMNKLWAMKVVDEFFAQGDEEKRLGIPVGMLNDRDKVSRSGAEHGFINFLLAPLVVSVVHVFPMMHPLGTQMVENMAAWHRAWVKESNPPPEDVDKRDVDIQKVRETLAKLAERERAHHQHAVDRLGGAPPGRSPSGRLRNFSK